MTIASGQQALAADILKSLNASGYVQLTDSSELTISSGAVTVTTNFYRVDTESDASSDNLDTITAGSGVADGHILFLRAESAARTVVVVHNSGNIMCRNGQNIILDDSEDWALLIYDGNLTKWLAMVGPQSSVYRRQGGSASVWSSVGTSNHSPLAPRMQAGAVNTQISGGQSTVSASVTFPAAFSAAPLVIASLGDASPREIYTLLIESLSTGFSVHVYRVGTSGVADVPVNWLAIGE